MIPKTIHYCWFGRGEKPKLAKKCIASWKKFCPDYKIIEWNEDNFDVNMNGYTKMCYEQKKYAFLSDYVRLYVVEKYGGLYFDTDVEVLKNIDHMLDCEAFYGFENDQFVATGLGFGSIAHGKAINMMLDEYVDLLDGKNNVMTCPKLNSKALDKLGLVRNGQYQNLDNTIIYPVSVMNPYDSVTGELNKTKETISIHWYSASWLSKGKRLRLMFTRPMRRIFGVNVFERFKK